jgi:hypothetical protein
MKLAVIAVILAAGVARADTVFEEYGAHTLIRDADQLIETSCDLDVELRGAVATVEMRQKIANPGQIPLAASYELELPLGAVMIGASVRGDGPLDAAVGVPARHATELAESADVLTPDPAIVMALESTTVARYRALVQPITPSRDAMLVTRWQAIAEVRDGAVRLALPARKSTARIAPCHGSVRAVAGPGTAIDKIRINGADGAKFVLDGSDVIVSAELKFAGKDPVLWTQSEELADGWTASLVTIVAPPVRSNALTAHRALFVIDGSRSMALVGTRNVTRIVHELGGALPANTEVEAIIYDRTSTRVLGGWKSANSATLTAIEAAIGSHVAANGSDLTGAMTLAHTMIADGTRGETMVIVVTDGVLGQLPDAALSTALAGKSSTVDVHAIVLDPGQTRSPGATALRNPVNLYGGSYVEVSVDDLDNALASVGAWLRPSWLELAVSGGKLDVPDQLRTGAGITRFAIHRGSSPAYVLGGRAESAVKIAARPGPAVSVAQLALARATDADLVKAERDEPNDAELARGAKVRAHATQRHPAADAEHALAILSGTGKVARSRRQMVKDGGPYLRAVAFADPAFEASIPSSPAAAPTATAIDRSTLERLFREQLQPRAYACYQRALGGAPKLEGTVVFELTMGRGEVSTVSLTNVGIANPAFEACLLDAAYSMSPPLPDFTVNADDQTIAHYPLSFQSHEQKPVIILGDADSSSPIDIDAVEGGVPVPASKHKPLKVDTKTPLGGLKPHP